MELGSNGVPGIFHRGEVTPFVSSLSYINSFLPVFDFHLDLNLSIALHIRPGFKRFRTVFTEITNCGNREWN